MSAEAPHRELVGDRVERAIERHADAAGEIEIEAGLSAMLVLAGVSAGDAVLATFAYRLFSHWLPLPLALLGLWLQRGV